ncbi:hypothetical protein [Acinetobacter baumannii]|uniref:hypothetical protein n=1 Tax=Acinetobacter baumannii TaxID=470 RepID=UPI00300619D8
MKPEQFIREFRVEKAREVVEGAPDKTATHYVIDTDTYYSEDFLTYFDHSLEDWETADLNNIAELETIYEHVVSLSDLKRLVESVDRVNAFGGLKDAKAVVKMGKHYKYLKAHISNYESIYGGGE